MTHPVEFRADSNDPLLSPATVAARLGVSIDTLKRWRMRGIGPEFCKLPRRVLYRASAVEAFIDGATMSCTLSQTGRR